MFEMLALLQQWPAAWWGLAGVLGLMVGSFLNVVIHRLPKMMERDMAEACAEFCGQGAPERPAYNLVVPRSACPQCGRMIRAWENIPVLSYLMLRGRCAGCSAHIAWRYPLIELSSGLLSVAVAWHFGCSWAGLGGLLLVWILLAASVIDLDHMLLPDDLTLPLLWLGLLFNIQGVFAPLPQAVIGAVAGYLSLWTVYWAFYWATGKQGMGYGDFKLLAALGAWFGWTLLPVLILASSVAGLVVGLASVGFGRQFPFGPYLALGGVATLFWGTSLRQWLLGF